MLPRAGRITAAGTAKEVTFESIDGPINVGRSRLTRRPPLPLDDRQARGVRLGGHRASTGRCPRQSGQGDGGSGEGFRTRPTL
jgi:hypothetical protein